MDEDPFASMAEVWIEADVIAINELLNALQAARANAKADHQGIVNIPRSCNRSFKGSKSLGRSYVAAMRAHFHEMNMLSRAAKQIDRIAKLQGPPIGVPVSCMAANGPNR